MKNKFGLLNADVEKIISAIKKQPKVQSALIFGSRAKGNFKPGSDVDLVLKGNELDFGIVNQISYWLNEETSMPYKFDVLDYKSISETDLVEHIDRVGIEIFNR